MSPNLNKLRNRLAYRCDGSEDYVRCIRCIAETRDVDAIRILARLLDMSGPAARAAMSALVGFGEAALPEMRRRHERSMDGAEIVHTAEVIARIARKTERAATRAERPIAA